MNYEKYIKLKDCALGSQKADLVLKNAVLTDVITGELRPDTDIAVKDGIIVGVGKGYSGIEEHDLKGSYVAPGLIDAHLHLESTMVSPNELVTTAARCGTTTFIVDPHEAANVKGLAGIDYILDQTEASPANVYVMMPSCVPATDIDDNGCVLTADDMTEYADNPRILGLGEVMDDIAVVCGKRDMFDKLDLFREKVIDGHAPYLPDNELSAYSLAGVATDHEASDFEYALKEVRRGIHVHIREGSAAHNLCDIVKGIVENNIDTRGFSFCTDDKHIEDILENGHISNNVRMAVALGLPFIKAIQMATVNTASCYGLKDEGAVIPGAKADMIVFDDPDDFRVRQVYHKGRLIDNDGEIKVKPAPVELKDTINCDNVSPQNFIYPISEGMTHVIGMKEGQITTEDLRVSFEKCDNYMPSDGYLKIAAIERHHNTGKIGVALAYGYGIKKGAVASSVSHDSHNIIVIGDNDRDMALAVNEIIRAKGGFALADDGKIYDTLPLPVMGLMSDEGFENVNAHLVRMRRRAHEMGVNEKMDPFITLSFMALPVIPTLRITPRGLYALTQSGLDKVE